MRDSIHWSTLATRNTRHAGDRTQCMGASQAPVLPLPPRGPWRQTTKGNAWLLTTRTVWQRHEWTKQQWQKSVSAQGGKEWNIHVYKLILKNRFKNVWQVTWMITSSGPQKTLTEEISAFSFLFQTVVKGLNYSKMWDVLFHGSLTNCQTATTAPPPPKNKVSYLSFLFRVLGELVVLDDFSLVLSGPITHPDPSKVLCALKQKMGQH